MSNKNKRFHRNQKSQMVSDSKQTKVKNFLDSLDMYNLNNYVKKVARQINYSNDVLDFIENPSKWSKPTKTPKYALTCVSHQESGTPLRGKFIANTIMQHWSLGEIAVSFGRPYIYPGKKCIYFPVRYLTKDQRLYREIVCFPVDFEPTQQAALNLYTAQLFLAKRGTKYIIEESGWNTSFLLRPVIDALRVAILKRQLAEYNDKLNNNIFGKGEAV